MFIVLYFDCFGQAGVGAERTEAVAEFVLRVELVESAPETEAVSAEAKLTEEPRATAGRVAEPSAQPEFVPVSVEELGRLHYILSSASQDSGKPRVEPGESAVQAPRLFVELKDSG